MSLTHDMVLLLLSAGLLAGAADSGTLTINRGGHRCATIVIADQPTRAAEFAATELQYHVAKITGATLPITTESAQVSGARVLVGESSATRSLGLRTASLKEREYLIRFLPDALILIGRDEPAMEQGDTAGRPRRGRGRFGRGLDWAIEALRRRGEHAAVLRWLEQAARRTDWPVSGVLAIQRIAELHVADSVLALLRLLIEAKNDEAETGKRW